ncbi:MAG TPA: hypothetical protein VE735_04530, partial [Gammaproteobacteria bacterium]|nr:hypothetical protein [Gammaproteobacteria bacterium]
TQRTLREFLAGRYLTQELRPEQQPEFFWYQAFKVPICRVDGGMGLPRRCRRMAPARRRRQRLRLGPGIGRGGVGA